MKHRFRTIQFCALVLAGLLVVGCREKATPSPTPVSISDAPGAAKVGRITALGTIRPAQTLQLSFGTSGPVRAVRVRLGTKVKAGDLLAELGTTALEIDLQSAQEQVALRQAALDQLMNGSSAAVVERAGFEHAQQVAQAEIALQVARWQLEQARLQDRASAAAIAQSQLQQLELQLAQARAQGSASGLAAAQVELERAKIALDETQDEYNKALDRPWEDQHVRDEGAKRLKQAQLNYRLAQARLDGANRANRAYAVKLEALAAQLPEAQARLEQTIKARDAYTVTLRRLSAEVEAAQLELDHLQAWKNPYLDPQSPEEIAQARARLRQAKLAVAQLEWQLEGAELRAPFNGVVSAVYLHPGEWGAPGVPTLELVDTARWYVETRNVGELVIGRVLVGQKAAVRVHAFQGEILHGRVDTISPVEVVQQGDTTYTLMIELDPTDLNLRSGMNAQVEILTE